MKPMLMARTSGYCDIYTRVVCPDYILHNIGSEPIIALFHVIDVAYTRARHVAGVISADMIGFLVGTSLSRGNPNMRELPRTGVSTHQLARECYDKCHHVGGKWQVVSGADVDELLWRLLEAVNDELFFI